MTAPPELSVVVPTHDRRDLLVRLLESLGRQTTPPDRFEVVVVVDGSTDGTLEAVADLATPFRLTVVDQPQAGQSAARNAGAARATGHVLLFVDDDEEADPGLVAAHLEAHRDRRRIAGVGVIERRVPVDADRVARLLAESAAAHTARLAKTTLTYLDAYGGNLSVPRSVFEEIGGYAEDLPRENDFEFAYRLHQARVEFAFLPGAIVTEYRERPWRGILRDIERRGQIAVELYRRHPPIIATMELGGYGWQSRGRVIGRTLLQALRAPPSVAALPAFALPAESALAWLRLVLDYCYWRGVEAAADAELWKRSRRGTTVLRYHAFGGPDEPPSRYVVPAARFNRQLSWLRRRGYNVISLTEYVEHRRAHRFPPAKSVVITMDDGYTDNDTLARPILERHGFSATIFMITGGAGRHAASDPALVDRPLLGLDRVRELVGGSIDVGAHTRSHPDLTAIDPPAAEAEVSGSKHDLERALGRPVGLFAYPQGAVDDRVRGIVAGAGFRAACGVKPGHNKPATDLFDLRRIEVRGTDSRLRFAAMVVVGEFRRRRSRGRD